MPRTRPLWQRGFFLVNCLVLRRLLASVRSGVVKTFRCRALAIRTPDQIAAELADTIRHVYKRPSMYSRASNIESTLWDFHWAWAIVHESETQFRKLHNDTLSRNKASSGLFSGFMHDNHDAAEDDALAFTLNEWRSISLALGVPLDS